MEMNNHQLNPPFKLSSTAYQELVELLKTDIGDKALEKLTEDEIHHIGHHLLTLTATQLHISIREKKRSVLDSN